MPWHCYYISCIYEFACYYLSSYQLVSQSRTWSWKTYLLLLEVPDKSSILEAEVSAFGLLSFMLALFRFTYCIMQKKNDFEWSSVKRKHKVLFSYCAYFCRCSNAMLGTRCTVVRFQSAIYSARSARYQNIPWTLMALGLLLSVPNMRATCETAVGTDIMHGIAGFIWNKTLCSCLGEWWYTSTVM